MQVQSFTRARWEVRWTHNKRVIVADFHDDFAEALRIYGKALVAGRRDVTLRPRNLGIEPPKRLKPYFIKAKKGQESRRIEPLSRYNLAGWLWCPYCVQLRKFVKRNGFHCENVWVPQAGHHCPMCGISHRDGTVQKWNPIARRWRDEGVRSSRRKKESDDTA